MFVDRYRKAFNLGAANPLIWTPGLITTNRVFSRAAGGVICDVNGIYQNVANNIERSGHYLGDLVTNGTLIEPARTNSALWSRDATNAVYTKLNTGTVTLNQVGLDGSVNSAATCADTDAVNAYQITQSVTIPNDNALHCCAWWVKKDTDQTRFPELKLQLSGGTAQARGVQLNTQTGAIVVETTAGTSTSRVINAGLWWIVEITVTNNTTGNVNLQAIYYPAAGVVLGTFAPTTTGSSILGQTQIELNSLQCTTPIYTTTTTVTRSVDGLHFTPFGLAIYPVTIYAKFISLGIDSGNIRVIQVGDNVSGNSILLNASGQAGAFQASTKDGVSFKNSSPSATTLLGDTLELRGFWDANLTAQMGISVNSGAEVIPAAGALPNAIPAYLPDLLAIGSVGAAHSTPITALFQNVKVLYGTKTMAEMRAA